MSQIVLKTLRKNNDGMAFTSEQGLESCHRRIGRIRDAFKTHIDNKHYPNNLKNLVITYLYRLKVWKTFVGNY